MADARRPKAKSPNAAQRIGRKLDAVPDRVDIRDWFYRPTLTTLPDLLVNCNAVPEILDQGTEGACTGFALAAVIQFLMAQRQIPKKELEISPRMLYEMARHYDEWPGEGYEGSSARGAMIGWIRHGVCERNVWPHSHFGSKHFTSAVAKNALLRPGGAFYRVMHRQVRDVHAALNEAGVVYCTLMVHNGWSNPTGSTLQITYVDNGNLRTIRLPVIQRQGDADSGHAVTIVGYTYDGFIIQNSWGESWGEGGFALLPYEDFMIHATDVWVAQLGVPVKTDLWQSQDGAIDASGLQRASESIPLEQIRPYVIDVGNNGALSDTGSYWTTEDDVHRLFHETIPDATQNWPRKRILLYLHGGLNDERAVASRIVAFKHVMMSNQIYPLHLMWESGAFETLSSLIEDAFVEPDARAGDVGAWLEKTRERLVEAKDRTFELTVARPGTAMWNEMKDNARLASESAKGAMKIIAAEVNNAMKGLTVADRKQYELHVVAHSAGSIFIAFALRHLITLGLDFKSLQFLAPAIRVDLFKKLLLPSIKNNQCPVPTLYVLSETGERDDDVGPWGAYGKSLLYLVSNAFEGRREVPLLGMQKFVSGDDSDGAVDAQVSTLFKKRSNGLPTLIVAGERYKDANGHELPGSRSESDSHGGFDNDAATLNSVLYRILGNKPIHSFETRDLQYGAHRVAAKNLLYPELYR